jgi:DNA polymerase elongation subunit (family B)
VHQAFVYDELDFVFDAFVQYFNKFRAKDKVHKILGKLMINSLYGKLASGIKNFDYLIANSEHEKEEIINRYTINKIFELNKIYIIEIESKEKLFGINIGLSSIITSKGRIKLYNAMHQTETNGGKVLYCDTDSLFIEFKNNVDYSLSS